MSNIPELVKQAEKYMKPFDSEQHELVEPLSEDMLESYVRWHESADRATAHAKQTFLKMEEATALRSLFFAGVKSKSFKAADAFLSPDSKGIGIVKTDDKIYIVKLLEDDEGKEDQASLQCKEKEKSCGISPRLQSLMQMGRD